MSVPVHFIVQPLAIILLIVAPEVDSLALNLIHLELSRVNRTIGKSELSMAVLLAFEVFALVYGTIRPRFQSETVLLVILPAAHVFGSISVSVRSMTVSFVIDPVAFINVAIRMVQLASAVGFAFAPLPLVAAPVQPLLLAFAIAHVVEPFALVDGARVEMHGAFDLSDALSHLNVFVVRVFWVNHGIWIILSHVVVVTGVSLEVLVTIIEQLGIFVEFIVGEGTFHLCGVNTAH